MLNAIPTPEICFQDGRISTNGQMSAAYSYGGQLPDNHCLDWNIQAETNPRYLPIFRIPS